MMNYYSISLILSCSAYASALMNVKTETHPHIQENAVRKLLERRLPNHHFLFFISVDSSLGEGNGDTFRVSSPMSYNDSRIHVTGTTGVAAAWGLMHYLKYFCNAHVSWEADQLHLPNPLPKAQFKITAYDRFRYYENVCMVSYSFVWWNWPRWQRHIDWMALNGINFPLAFTAQESIWRRIYLTLKLTEREMSEHFAGPAFLAWGRMGNIRSWGGPISKSWYQQTEDLQLNILKMMRDIGMIPILPAFAGHIPKGIIRQYPTAKYTRLRNWGHFKDNYTRTYLLQPSDPLFMKIGNLFINEMKKTYNYTSHVYNCDPFNEMLPESKNYSYLRKYAKSIFSGMTGADSKAVWVLQGWMFKKKDFWTYDAAKSFLTAIPKGRLIILDLQADLNPQYERLDSFFNQPFIFCYLGNFGGADGLYGNMDAYLRNLRKARSNSSLSLVGTGITSEGINQNYVMYDLISELGFRIPFFNVDLWARRYAMRRYGRSYRPSLGTAWQKLMGSVYNFFNETSFHGSNTQLCHRPSLKRPTKIQYDISELISAWDLFVDIQSEVAGRGETLSPIDALILTTNDLNSVHSSAGTEETLRHDLVDVTREVLQVYGNFLVESLKEAYHQKSSSKVSKIGIGILSLLDDLELILGTSQSFLLGSWISQAASWSTNEQERTHYIRNTLHQLSLWGPNGEILDYAVKQWAGVVKYYMKPRWRLFVTEVVDCLKRGTTPFNESQFEKDVFEGAEKVFANGVNIPFRKKPQGDPIAIGKILHRKYRSRFNDSFFTKLNEFAASYVNSEPKTTEHVLFDEEVS